jgi:hypothetical protein
MQHEEEQHLQPDLRKVEFRRKGTGGEQGGEELKEGVDRGCKNGGI